MRLAPQNKQAPKLPPSPTVAHGPTSATASCACLSLPRACKSLYPAHRCPHLLHRPPRLAPSRDTAIVARFCRRLSSSTNSAASGAKAGLHLCRLTPSGAAFRPCSTAPPLSSAALRSCCPNPSDAILRLCRPTPSGAVPLEILIVSLPSFFDFVLLPLLFSNCLHYYPDRKSVV